MRWRTPDDWAAAIAAKRSFLACLHGLHRFGSFFSPLSWKKTCSPAVQIKFSVQSTHLIALSWYSLSGLITASEAASVCDMIYSLGRLKSNDAGGLITNFIRQEVIVLPVRIQYCCAELFSRGCRCAKSISMAKLCQVKPVPFDRIQVGHLSLGASGHQRFHSK